MLILSCGRQLSLLGLMVLCRWAVCCSPKPQQQYTQCTSWLHTPQTAKEAKEATGLYMCGVAFCPRLVVVVPPAS